MSINDDYNARPGDASRLHNHRHDMIPYASAANLGLQQRDEGAVHNVEVSNGVLFTQSHSTAILPMICASCGSTESGGIFLDRKINWAPKLIYLTLLISPFLFFLVYFAVRKRQPVNYYLCPVCADRFKSRQVLVGTSWLGLAALLIIGGMFGAGEVVLIGSGLIFMAMFIIAIFTKPALNVVSYNDGQFMLRSKSPMFTQKLSQYLKGRPHADKEPAQLRFDAPIDRIPSTPPRNIAGIRPNVPSPKPDPDGTDGTI